MALPKEWNSQAGGDWVSSCGMGCGLQWWPLEWDVSLRWESTAGKASFRAVQRCLGTVPTSG